MSGESNVVNFYVLCNKLKDIIRTGWKLWGVKRERVESIAEHVYGVQMLAIAMWSEFRYDIDIVKVLSMLAVHELEEITIGDLTFFDVDLKSKNEMGHKAIEQVLAQLQRGEDVNDLILEFDERKTPEAQFSFFCDKLEADLQSKIYDEQNCVNVNSEVYRNMKNNEKIKDTFKGKKTWSEWWLDYSAGKYNYDENFLSVSNYVKNNEILKK